MTLKRLAEGHDDDNAVGDGVWSWMIAAATHLVNSAPLRGWGSAGTMTTLLAPGVEAWAAARRW